MCSQGFDVLGKLAQMLRYTTDSQLRRFLTKELRNAGDIHTINTQALQLSETLDSLYPCESFQEALKAGRRWDTNCFTSATLSLRLPLFRHVCCYFILSVVLSQVLHGLFILFNHKHQFDSLWIWSHFRTGSARFPSSDIFQVSKYCGEVGVVSPDTKLSQWYCHYMLDWLSHWLPCSDDIIIERVLHDRGMIF